MILQGDVREILPRLESESVHCCVTSPPYWGLRDYGCEGQIGLEATPDEYVSTMVAVFREVRRVLRKDGTLWLNMGDSYASTWSCGRRNAVGNEACDYGQRQDRRSGGLKEKDLVGIPWLLAFALRADGWYLRQDIIWSKPNPMPESVRDRCTKAHEYIFLLSKSEKYYYDAEAILDDCSESTHARLSQDVQNQIGSERAHAGGKTNGNMKAVGRKDLPETQSRPADYRDNQRKLAKEGSGIMPGKRNKRSVWEVTTQPFSEAHFATFPPGLIKPCILAGCPAGGTVLDPFFGAGTTGLVARELNCDYIGIELNPEYIAIAEKRLSQEVMQFSGATA